MAAKVTRRDFLNGIAIGVGGSLLTPAGLFGHVDPMTVAPGTEPLYYPPTLTGMRE